MITVNSIVRYKDPLGPEEAQALFKVIEINGDRCLIEYICTMAILPITLERVENLEEVE